VRCAPKLWCVCRVRNPSPLLYRGLAWSVGGNIPQIHPAPSASTLVTVGTQRMGLRGARGRNFAQGARAWWGPIGLCFTLLPLLWAWISVDRWVGLGLALVGLLPPLVPFTLSRKRLLSYVSLVSSACFCIHINSTDTSENRSEAYVYVCIDVYFPLLAV
jgi:hypothetical protein